ncbi:hypothetical protein VTK73DRAFT_4615 [Phialemonium thermophilum]|uniref:ABC transporter domain-containing protein n=1 Tax=Phialemonium thermophilum TaxID=223376 RepID=A0ABR3WT31_9PEZI
MSAASESTSTILVSCKQTRFHIESPNYRELDIEGLSIAVTSGDKQSAKGKWKAKADGVEILSNAKLRLKAGQRYALVGRNGSGKSTLLRAIAEKLIPGVPEKTRVAILQQTNDADGSVGTAASDGAPSGNNAAPQGSRVLEYVVDKATSKNELEQEINILAEGISNENAFSALRSLRRVRHQRLQKQCFVLDKKARLRSGARGAQARKALTEFEKVVAESEALVGQADDDISPDTLQAETQEAADLLAELQLQVEPSKLANIESQAKKILSGLGFSDAYMEKPVSSLSGGWLMRTELAATLLQESDILILDEPTNFLDLLGIIWLQRYLQSLEDTPEPPTMILVSHDRDFINLATDLLIIKDKAITYFHGDLVTYEESQAERKVYLTKMKEAQDRQKAHIQETIARNIRQGKKKDDDNKLRQAKSRQKKLDDRWGLEVGSRGGRFKLNRDLVGYHLTARAEIDVPADERPVVINLPEPPDLRFPGALISLEGASFRYPAEQSAGKQSSRSSPAAPIVLQDLNLSVHIGDRIGVVGLNGAGKTTLIRLLVGETRPSSGTATMHPRLRLGYYSQQAVDTLRSLGRSEPQLTALGLLGREAEASGQDDDDSSGSSSQSREGRLRGLLASFGLAGRVASDVPLGKLSGGQLVRCELARLLYRRPHCLVLDEVTTHLDYETVAALRDALMGWEGAVVLVSHDRWFMRGVVEGIIDDPIGGSDDEHGNGESAEDSEMTRRREIYRLRGGKLVRLQNGVQDFEDAMGKRVKKLLSD